MRLEWLNRVIKWYQKAVKITKKVAREKPESDQKVAKNSHQSDMSQMKHKNSKMY